MQRYSHFIFATKSGILCQVQEHENKKYDEFCSNIG